MPVLREICVIYLQEAFDMLSRVTGFVAKYAIKATIVFTKVMFALALLCGAAIGVGISICFYVLSALEVIEGDSDK